MTRSAPKLALGMIIAVSLVAGVRIGIADTITVDTTSDLPAADGHCSLREAISAANDDVAVDGCATGSGPDVIQIPAGTYTLTRVGSSDDDNLTGDLDIAAKLALLGLDGSDNVIIDAAGIDRVLHVLPGIGLNIEGLTITGGEMNTGTGGGILNEGVLSIVDSVVSSNSAAQGGGITNAEGAILIVEGSSITANESLGSGGGIYNASSAANPLRLSWSSIHDNHSQLHGGGVVTRGVTIAYSGITGNTAGGNGAGIFWPTDSGHPNSIVNSTLSGNLSAGHGGAIYFDGFGWLKLRSVTISDNTADSDADDVGDGGGIYQAGGTVLPKNTVVAGNHDLSPGTFAVFAPDCVGSIDSVGYNLFGEVGLGYCVIEGETTGNQVGIIGDALDPDLEPLDMNGGASYNHSPRATSPLVDAGDPGGCTDADDQPLNVDQRNNERHVDGPDPDLEAVCDIGAVEYDSAIMRDGFEDGTTDRWSAVEGGV